MTVVHRLAHGPKIRWGLSSTGRMAEWFATDFAQVTDGELVSVASRSGERAAAFARRFDIPGHHSCFRSLVEDPAVDVVYVSSPHSLHANHVAVALRAGKAVLCEKPLTVTPGETEALIQLAESTGGYLMEALWTYFLPAIQTARRWVDEGRIGRIIHLKADFGYPQVYAPDKREYAVDLGGGALLEMGIYPVAIAWYFSRRHPTSIHAVGRRAPNGVEDDLSVLFDYADSDAPLNSCTATLGTSFRCKLPNSAHIVGETGHITIPDFWRATSCRLHRLDECVDSFEESRVHQGFCHEANAVNDDLRNGRRQSEIVPLDTSLTLQRHMDAIRRQLG